jgi:hypothetical protein
VVRIFDRYGLLLLVLVVAVYMHLWCLASSYSQASVFTNKKHKKYH